jgi:hypothetical protein
MLTVTLMSLGVLKLPGTEHETFRNSYGFEIDFQWWPVLSSIISVIGILLGTLWMFQPIVEETNKIVGYLIFVPIFVFRLLTWLLVILMLESFSIFLFGAAVLINAFVLFMVQKASLVHFLNNLNILQPLDLNYFVESFFLLFGISI